MAIQPRGPAVQSNGMATTAPQAVATPTVDNNIAATQSANAAYAAQNPNVFGPSSTSTTAISNSNKISQVPGIVNKTNELAKTGVTTDANGNATYANGTSVPQAPETPAYAAPKTPSTSSTGGYVGDVYYAPGSELPKGADGKPVVTTQTSPTDDTILNSLNDLKSQTDATTASLIDGIHSQYAQLRQQQEQTNKGQEAGVNNALLMGGVTGQGSSAQYAPISSSGIIQAQVSYGLQQIADLNAKEQSAIIQAQIAGQQQKFQVQDKINQQIDKIRDEKVAAAVSLNEKIATQNQKMADEKLSIDKDNAIASLYQDGTTDPKEILKQLRDLGMTVTSKEVADTITNITPSIEERKLQRSAIDFAINNQITKPFYLAGNTAINSETGEKVDLATYQKLTGQKVGAPESETDWSFIQTDVQTPDERKFSFDVDKENFDRSVTMQRLAMDQAKSDYDMSGAGDIVKNQTDLRKEYNGLPVVKEYNTVKQNYSTIKSAAEEAKSATNKAAADQILIVAFNKMIDPSSTVREGEFARSTEGQSLINRLKGKADAALEGGVGLSEGDRQAIVDATETLYKGYLKNYSQNALQYRGYAGELKADPDKVAPIGEQEGQFLLDDYIQSNPSQISNIDVIEKENPNITDLEILQILGAPGFEPVGKTSDSTSSNTSYTPLQNKNLSFAPDVEVPKVTIGAGAGLKNNNPGNLRNIDGSWMKFSTPEEGFKGLMGYLERAKNGDHTAYKPTQTLYQFFAKYAPAADSNNPTAYADSVAKKLGVSPNTTINKLDTFAWAKEIAKHESSTNIG